MVRMEEKQVVDIITILKGVLDAIKSLGWLASLVFPKTKGWITKIEEAIKALQALL